MTVHEHAAHPAPSELPFAAAEIVIEAGRPGAVLDVGCGSGRLTVELARAGAAVTGIDTSQARLADAQERTAQASVELRLLRADMNDRLPFEDDTFDAVVSRLALMVARDPVATLRESARVLRPGGVVVTAVWAAVEQNPWFGEARSAVAEALGDEPARFAHAFGRLGSRDELEQVHRSAGFGEVRGRTLNDAVRAVDAAQHWAYLTHSIGHYTRIAATLSPKTAERLLDVLAARLAPYRVAGELVMPRRIVLVTARRPA